MVIEGTTKFLGLPFAVLAVITGFLLWRNPARRTSLLAFFLLGYLVALVLFAVWGIWQGGLPEFSAAGLL
jgi:uncharacterized membrane protein